LRYVYAFIDHRRSLLTGRHLVAGDLSLRSFGLSFVAVRRFVGGVFDVGSGMFHGMFETFGRAFDLIFESHASVVPLPHGVETEMRVLLRPVWNSARLGKQAANERSAPEREPMDILSVLKQEHREVASLLDEVKDLEPSDQRMAELAHEIEAALTVHATLEEKLFYPQLKSRAEEEDDKVDVFEAYTEHDVVKHLIALLQSQRRRDERFKAELQVLGENVKHHVSEEESTVFGLARQLLDRDELEEIGEKWERAKLRLTPSNGKVAKPPAAARKKSAARR
jgi:hemerythrin superfamily protein